jgi:hypothetical protein
MKLTECASKFIHKAMWQYYYLPRVKGGNVLFMKTEIKEGDGWVMVSDEYYDGSSANRKKIVDAMCSVYPLDSDIVRRITFVRMKANYLGGSDWEWKPVNNMGIRTQVINGNPLPPVTVKLLKPDKKIIQSNIE